MKRILILVIVTMSSSQLLEASRSRAGARHQQPAHAASITQAQIAQNAAAIPAPIAAVQEHNDQQAVAATTKTHDQALADIRTQYAAEKAALKPTTNYLLAPAKNPEKRAVVLAALAARDKVRTKALADKKASQKPVDVDRLVAKLQALLSEKTAFDEEKRTAARAIITQAFIQAKKEGKLKETRTGLISKLPGNLSTATFDSVRLLIRCAAAELPHTKIQQPVEKPKSWFYWS